jgi:hypothetical protein
MRELISQYERKLAGLRHVSAVELDKKNKEIEAKEQLHRKAQQLYYKTIS